MTSGMPLREVPVVVTNLERYGSRGWSFDVVIRQGRPSEYRKSFRTSTAGRGLDKMIRAAVPAQHKYGMDFLARPEIWREELWLNKKYQWPQQKQAMEKQLRIFFKNLVRLDIR